MKNFRGSGDSELPTETRVVVVLTAFLGSVLFFLWCFVSRLFFFTFGFFLLFVRDLCGGKIDFLVRFSRMSNYLGAHCYGDSVQVNSC